jgi:hypothetical protein
MLYSGFAMGVDRTRFPMGLVGHNNACGPGWPGPHLVALVEWGMIGGAAGSNAVGQAAIRIQRSAGALAKYIR